MRTCFPVTYRWFPGHGWGLGPCFVCVQLPVSSPPKFSRLLLTQCRPGPEDLDRGERGKDFNGCLQRATGPGRGLWVGDSQPFGTNPGPCHLGGAVGCSLVGRGPPSPWSPLSMSPGSAQAQASAKLACVALALERWGLPNCEIQGSFSEGRLPC